MVRHGVKSNGLVASIWLKIVSPVDDAVAWVTVRPVIEYKQTAVPWSLVRARRRQHQSEVASPVARQDVRPSRSSENASTGTSASPSKLLCSHCPRQKQPWASTLVCLLSQRCQTTPRLKTRDCIAKRRRNFVVPSVV